MYHPITNHIENLIKALIADSKPTADCSDAMSVSAAKMELDNEIEKLLKDKKGLNIPS